MYIRDMAAQQKPPAAAVADDSLEKIAAEVRGCPLCKLSRTRKNAEGCEQTAYPVVRQVARKARQELRHLTSP